VPAILDIQNISLTLGGQRILQGVTCSTRQGEIVGLIGPNGSGKTTLFNVISGFLPPDEGSVKFRGEDITSLPSNIRAQRGIGRVFQNFGIFREMTLEENMLVALEALPRPQRKALGKLDEKGRYILSLIGLYERRKEKTCSLSGGQMRLLEIGRTLASGKELFLLDEPTAGVAPKMTRHVSDLIGRLKGEGKTVFIIEHDLPFISRICDRVLVLDVGKIALEGTPQQVQRSKELKEIYFGADPTT
jgi:ABC-type branched-subunit amino acid transport system ATPase component